MKKLAVIGNLGADAERKVENGRPFISMSIADTRRRTDESGKTIETTEWISATMNGENERLLPYLKKGVRVYASGDCAVRQYHSEKMRALVAGLNLYVRELELITTNTDPVPRDLYDEQGVAYRVQKYYNVGDIKKTALFDRHGVKYDVGRNGWVTIPASTDNAETQETAGDAETQETTENNAEPFL